MWQKIALSIKKALTKAPQDRKSVIFGNNMCKIKTKKLQKIKKQMQKYRHATQTERKGIKKEKTDAFKENATKKHGKSKQSLAKPRYFFAKHKK